MATSKQEPVKIPKFGGREVDAVAHAFSGSDDQMPSILEPGEEITLIVKAKVTGVAHKENQFGVMKRVQSIKIAHAVQADEVTAKKLTREIKIRADEAAGQESLDSDIDPAEEGDA